MDALHVAIARAKFTPFPVRPTNGRAPDEKHVEELIAALSAVINGKLKEISDRVAVLEARFPHVPQAEQPTLTEGGPNNRPSIEFIKRLVCRHYSIEVNEMDSRRQNQLIVRPRHIAIYLADRLTIRSRPQIGRAFGQRDHTTVLHAVNKITAQRNIDTELALELAELERALLGTSLA